MGPESPWGMVLHYPHEHLINILKQGGVAWLRTEVRFDSQPGPNGTPPWQDAIRKVQAAKSAPVQHVYFGIDPGYPNWIASGAPPPDDGDDNGPGPIPRRRPRLPGNNEGSEDWQNRYTHWEKFVVKVINTFGPMGVLYFNIGNEPNDINFYRFGSHEYTNLLSIAVRVIHAAGYKVCAPDIATGAHNPWPFLEACLRRLRDDNQTLDVVSIHGYRKKKDSVNDFMDKLRPVIGTMRKYGVDAPVWLTETGVSHFDYPTDPAQNARRVKELCQWIGEGPVQTPPRPWTPRKFLGKIFFFVWSEHANESGKYAWLSRPPALEPLPHLWNAYKSVTGGS